MNWLLYLSGVLFILFLLVLILHNRWAVLKRHPEWCITFKIVFFTAALLFTGIWMIEKKEIPKIIDTKFQFETAATIGLLFGIFSLLSFVIAKKIENLIRYKIIGFGDFTEYALKVLLDESDTYRIMLVFPFWGLIKSIETKVRSLERQRRNINSRFEELIEDSPKTVKVICGNRKVRMKFLQKIRSKDLSQNGRIYLEKEGKKIDWNAVYKLKNKVGGKFLSYESPIHVIISDHQVVWGNVEGYGRCIGFWSADETIRNSFIGIFEDYWREIATKND